VERFQRGETSLAWAREGDAGDPVVLVHGALDDHRLWSRVVPGLSASTQTLVYDRRGHGDSRGTRSPHRVRTDEADLAALLEATGLYPAHVVASGYAGAVAVRLAIDRPELVRSAVLHEPLYFGLLPEPDRSTATEALRTLDSLAGRAAPRGYLALLGGADERWDALDPAWQREFEGNALELAVEVADPEATSVPPEELEAVAIPVLTTVGERSPPAAPAIGSRLEALLPNGRTAVLPGTGHLAPRTDPDRNVPTT
jgi:pimeloyl-ACP methyl ester carboxylesterase